METTLNYILLLARKGGMLVCDGDRDVYPTDDELALELGKAILEELENACKDTAQVSIKIKMGENITQ